MLQKFSPSVLCLIMSINYHLALFQIFMGLKTSFPIAVFSVFLLFSILRGNVFQSKHKNRNYYILLQLLIFT